MIDIVIFGGGIAGLWTLARLRGMGYQAVLFESNTLGCGQTGASQGIIHGGTKYALTGKLTHSSQAIAGMPELWRKCIAGQGEVDLSRIKVLSENQYLWANKNIGSQLAGFFAGKVMNSRMKSLKKQDHPDFFEPPHFKGTVYELNEPVLDSMSLVSELFRQYQDSIYSLNPEAIERLSSQKYIIRGAGISIETKAIVLTAGNSNQQLLDLVGLKRPQMQQRPLYQPLIKAKKGMLPHIYAHCLGASALPRMTISSYEIGDEVVWYLGGEIAEKGIDRSLSEQVQATRQEMQTWVPWISFEQCLWSAYYINRAEPKMPDSGRPTDPFIDEQEGIITAWPVKLAMTPIMANGVIEKINSLGIQPGLTMRKQQTLSQLNLDKPKISPAPWELNQDWL